MGTLWLGGAEGLICPKFYTDNHKHPPPPLDIARVTSSTLPKFWKTPLLLDIHKHPPLDIACVTSSSTFKRDSQAPPLDIACVTSSSTFQRG